MGTFFSSEHLKNVTESLQIIQDNIVSQKTLGDAAWLQVKDIHDRLDDIKITLYNKVCSRCKSKVKKILGETPSRRRNLINDLPPERQMLLRDLARSMVEMEISKSGNKDVSDVDISLTLNYFDENRYAKMVEAYEATIEEYKKLLRDAKENVKTAESEKDEFSVSLIEKELIINEERNRLEMMQAEKDEQQAKIEARTREGSKLASKNSCLEKEIVVLRTQLDAQNKALDRLKETRGFPLETDVEENRHAHLTTCEASKRGEGDKEVLQLRQEKMSTIIDELQRNQGTKTDELDSAVSELKEFKSKKKSVVMGIRTEGSGMGKTMVDMVFKELTKRLHCILDREGIAITIQLCQTPAEVTNGPLVVLCLNMSRVGTNIISALEGIKASQDVFVLVLHNTHKDNLSLLTPTGLRITGSELRQLGGIIDMAFGSDSGVYDCDFNSCAVDKMATTLRKYARKPDC